MAAGEIQFLARQTRKATLALDHEEPHVVLTQKPSWFKSPLASGDSQQSSKAPHSHPQLHYTQSFDSIKNNEDNAIPDENGCYDGYPPFKRYEEPTLLEILYDLFFAANYNVFAQNQSVTNHQRFKAYVGYFSLLWGTWFVVTLYDVRYVTDSIFERMARAIQLGVLVGFAVVAPNFDPEDQSRSTMMTMSLILCASRVCLAIEYAHTLAQVYKYKRARRPLYAQIAINAISAAVYLGITFRFEKRNSRVYITWYIFTAGEAVLTLLLSNFWRTLSFTRTHLMKRLSLITVMILGEGIQSVAQNIATIVKTPAAWNSYTIGVITSATGTIYFVFLVYFDWMRQLQLPPWRQQIWTSLHYPFHLALVLFMQGFTQLILWGKAFNVFNHLTSGWLQDSGPLHASDFDGISSRLVAEAFSNQTAEMFALYPPKYPEAWTAVNASIANITTLPDNLWTTLQQYVATQDDSVFTDDTVDSFVTFVEQANVIISSMANSVFNTFDIDLSTELQQKHPNASSIIKSAEYQVTISDKTQKRSRLVFAYTYIACACTMTLLVLMALISRMTPLGRWPRVRFLVCALLGLGVGLTAILFFDHRKSDLFLTGTWPMPTLLFVWLAATVLVHIRGGSSRHARETIYHVLSLFQRRRRRPAAVTPAQQQAESDGFEMPLHTWRPQSRGNSEPSSQAVTTVHNQNEKFEDLALSPSHGQQSKLSHSVDRWETHTAERRVDNSDRV